MRTMTKLAEIVRELTEKAENEVKTIIQSEKELAEYLTFCSKFYHYSSRNQLLIYHQRPGAVSCLGFSEMKKRGLHLRKGSKAIQILAPMIVKEEDEQTQEEIEKVKGYKYVNVFDITQTDLAPEDYPKHFPNKPYIFKYDFNIDDMQRAIQSLANDMHVTIEIDTNDSVGAARGAYYPQLEKILLNAGNTESQNIAVQFHELAHAHLHNFRKNPNLTKPLRKHKQKWLRTSFQNILAWIQPKNPFTILAAGPISLKQSRTKNYRMYFQKFKIRQNISS